jgi:hypothetical protein
LKDIAVVDPITTGRVLINERETREGLLEQLAQGQAPQTQIISHHLRRSVHEYLVALAFLEDCQEQLSLKSLEAALVNLSFASSYFFAAREYSSDVAQVLTMSELEFRFDLLRDVRSRIELLRKGSAVLMTEVGGLVERFERYLLSRP